MTTILHLSPGHSQVRVLVCHKVPISLISLSFAMILFRIPVPALSSTAPSAADVQLASLLAHARSTCDLNRFPPPVASVTASHLELHRDGSPSARMMTSTPPHSLAPSDSAPVLPAISGGDTRFGLLARSYGQFIPICGSYPSSSSQSYFSSSAIDLSSITPAMTVGQPGASRVLRLLLLHHRINC